MKKRMETGVARRLLSLTVCSCMVLSLLPVSALAEEDCPHHPAHTEDCGYVEAVAGQDCGHVHDDACGYREAADCDHQHDETCGYREASDCIHQHTEECGEAGQDCGHVHDDVCGYQEAADCGHQHDETCGYQEASDCGHQHDDACGYVAAVAGQPCGFVCEICASQQRAAQVQALIDALPEDVTAETREAAQSALADVDRAKSALTAEEQAMLHMTRYTALREKLAAWIPPEPHTGWVKEDGNWYYLVDGVKQTGWQSGISGWEGKWLYFDPETGVMQTGWQNNLPGWEGKWFYFDPATGVMQTGWQNSIPGYEGKWLYFDPATGVMQTGWQNNLPGYEGKWFYFDPATGAMQTDLQGGVPDYVGAWYYLDPATGAIQTGGVQSRSQSGTFNGSPAEVDANGNLLINETNFPDGNFRAIVSRYDTDSDGSLSTAEVGAVTDISFASEAISSLKGIEYFTALTKLACTDNKLTTLDVSKNTALIQLNCDENKLTSLDVSSNTALELLGCSKNRLTSLDVRSNKALTVLNCNENQLTSLDVSQNTKLTNLYCDINWLTELDVSCNTDLTILSCGYNQLTTLDVSNNTALINLVCDNNQLTSLDLGSNGALTDIIVGNQKVAGEYVPLGSKYLLNLGELVGSGNLSRVSITSGGSFDSTPGMVTLEAPANGEATFKYNYNTQNGSMDVTLTLTAHTHSFDENGDCPCGLVKQVPYVDAQGAAQTPQVCIPITENTTALESGWYVASGSVTVNRSLGCNGAVNLILEDGCDLTVNKGIGVNSGNSLTIYAQSTGSGMGALTVPSGNLSGYVAGIGGTNSSITINGGIITATGGAGGAGIGSGSDGTACNVTINGGIVTATGGASGGAGIGSGKNSSNCGVTINGGIITATGGAYGGAGIGNGSNSRGATFSTGTNGNAVIFASSISDQSGKSDWSGVIFESDAGKVYGSPTLSLGLPVPDGKNLTLDMDSNSLTFAQGTGITLGSGSTLTLSGPGTFPGGISVTGGTLAELPAAGWAFSRNGIRVPVSNETSLPGEIGLSRITITITGQPTDVDMTYGENKSLSVTAAPTTSGDPVSYQWYLDGTALPGETGSNRSLSLSTLNAGSHQIYCAVTCDGFTVDSNTVTVTVGKAASSVRFTDDPGKTYDGLPAILNQNMYTTTGGTARVEYKLKGADDSTYTLSVPKNAGNYTVRVTAEDANHTAASDTRDFTITPKEVTLTVTVKEKAFDGTTTAEIDTATLGGIVSGDSVQVVPGTPTFARSAPGGSIPVGITPFSLSGTHAGNYRLTQPTGVTGSIRPSGRYLNLEGKADFAGHTEVWVDGVAYPIQTDDGRYVTLPETGNLLTIYTYQSGSSALSHENYPTGMAVYRIDRQDSGAEAAKIDELDDLLQYSGCSIRVTGKRGIRMITSLTKENKKALTKADLAGFTLEEYGTVVQWADTLGAQSLTLDTGKHNFAYRRGKADPVFATLGELTQYTNVLVDFTLEECKKDIVLRPYIILKDAGGQTVTLYGGCVSRSIGYIASQNRTGVFKPGTAAYKYVWEIIHAVYGTQFDSEYQG